MQVNIISKKIHINFKYSLYYKEFAQQITIVKGAMVKKTWIYEVFNKRWEGTA